MVWFQCDDCGDTLKKPKVQAHTYRCSASRFTCVEYVPPTRVPSDHPCDKRQHACVSTHRQERIDDGRKQTFVCSRNCRENAARIWLNGLADRPFGRERVLQLFCHIRFLQRAWTHIVCDRARKVRFRSNETRWCCGQIDWAGAKSNQQYRRGNRRCTLPLHETTLAL